VTDTLIGKFVTVTSVSITEAWGDRTTRCGSCDLRCELTS